MADSSCTRDERRERIVAECNAVRQALQELLNEYMTNAGEAEVCHLDYRCRVSHGIRVAGKKPTEQLDSAIETMCRKTRDLRRQLRKAVVDHVSDSFLESTVPLIALVEAAKAGQEKEVDELSVVFTEHASKLVEVGLL